MNEFKSWLEQSPHYAKLVYIYGDRIFIARDGVFDNLTIQLAYEAFQHQQNVNIGLIPMLIEQNNQLIKINYEQNAQINELLIQLSEDDPEPKTVHKNLDD